MKVLPAGIDLRRRRRIRSLYPFTVAVTCGQVGVAVALSAVVDLTDGGTAFWRLAACAVVLLGIGGVGILQIAPRRRPPRIASINALVLAFTVASAVGAVVYLVTDATDRLDDALFDSVAGFTTTNFSAIDFADAPRGVTFFRVFTQWLGAFGALIFAVGVIPTLGKSRNESIVHRVDAPTLAPMFRLGAARVLRVYLGLTALLLVAYPLAGSGLFDGLMLALSTASTGGFVPHAGSLAYYDSAAIEWVAIVGMLVAGMSVAALWWLSMGRLRPLTRSIELRVYLAIAVASIVVVTSWIWADAGAGESAVREASLSVTSAMSTTGFVSQGWASFDVAAQTLLLLLVGVGSMAGSAGGGFRVLRLVEAVRLAKQDLIQELHPTAVTVVRIDGASIGDAAIERLHSYMVLALGTIGVGTMLMDLSGHDLLTSISASVSAFATMGPGLGDVAGSPDMHDIDAAARLGLMPIMMLGRLSIYPVLLSVSSVGVWAERRGRR